jgi:DNA repair photolyase
MLKGKKRNNKVSFKTSDGKTIEAFAPVIVSASRATDIPAFYSDWFFKRLEEGYSVWKNPFNGVSSYVSYKNTRFIVFWSKNPFPLLKHLNKLKMRNIGCYIQYTLNDYEAEGLEKGVPSLAFRIDSFKKLVEKLGKKHVIWRFDPMLLTDNISIDNLLEKVERIGNQLVGYTEKLVFSFADILDYRKVKTNLEKNQIHYRDWTESQMIEFAEHLVALNKKWNYTLATCGEKIDLKQFGIIRNSCIDDELIIRLAYGDKTLMDFLKVTINPMPTKDLFGKAEPLPSDAIILPNNTYAIHGDNRDKGQRQFCGCIKSKDIGEYNTCPHLCEYCYANTSKKIATENYKRHINNPESETIIGI